MCQYKTEFAKCCMLKPESAPVVFDSQKSPFQYTNRTHLHVHQHSKPGQTSRNQCRVHDIICSANGKHLVIGVNRCAAASFTPAASHWSYTPPTHTHTPDTPAGPPVLVILLEAEAKFHFDSKSNERRRRPCNPAYNRAVIWRQTHANTSSTSLHLCQRLCSRVVEKRKWDQLAESEKQRLLLFRDAII